MKKAFLSLLTFFVLSTAAQAADSTPETVFIDKIWKAVESRKAESFMPLYYQGLPKELEPTFKELWNNLLTHGINSVAIKPVTEEEAKSEPASATIKDTTYVRNPAPSATLILTFKSDSASQGRFPISLVDGKYYLSSWKAQ
ncbi:hypothetical protein H5P28_18215 [Ruficoccus amylovorans]|uniref:DUF3887 domain-containing protein n=1 Tax=Ruficoccus amylovorans TaxID=1804625 RepID=A0A842HL62_9BACT|nr:hypothetical protein [Ruficoccus amylovorans]MBC2596207.1 hypothetical protein [Ruficoccus amylovorans]